MIVFALTVVTFKGHVLSVKQKQSSCASSLSLATSLYLAKNIALSPLKTIDDQPCGSLKQCSVLASCQKLTAYHTSVTLLHLLVQRPCHELRHPFVACIACTCCSAATSRTAAAATSRSSVCGVHKVCEQFLWQLPDL